MAEGAVARSNADLAVSVTGYAEAGQGPDQPAGLVHFGLAIRGGPTHHQVRQFGDIGRAAVRIACLETALAMMEAELSRRVEA